MDGAPHILDGVFCVDDGLTLDLDGAQAHTNRGTVSLTATEVSLLQCLVRSAGRPVPGSLLRSQVWQDSPASEEALRRAIFHLRQKLEPDPGHPRYIRAKPQSGYLLAMPGTFVLSEQQQEVLRRVARGQTDNEIAVQLGLSSRTVGTHMQAVRSLLGACSRSHAVALAMSRGLLSALDVQPESPPGDSG